MVEVCASKEEDERLEVGLSQEGEKSGGSSEVPVLASGQKMTAPPHSFFFFFFFFFFFLSSPPTYWKLPAGGGSRASASGAPPHPILFFFFFFFSFFLRLHLPHMEVRRLGVESELQLLAYATATATLDPSCVRDLHRSLRQRRIPDPLSEARDQTPIFMDTSQVLNPLSHKNS